jgi:6-hydroxy-3-succinoylpyridine 3-monooxygenase
MAVWLDHLTCRRKSRRKPVFSFLGMAGLKTRIYIDGYNLYYGCLKGTALKWLDLLTLFERQILPSVTAEQNGHRIDFDLEPLAIKFFTAPILARMAKADDSVQCQDRYHAALTKHLPGRIEIIRGYYALTTTCAKVVDTHAPKKAPRECLEATIWKLEEKQSDVNLALHVLADVLLGGIEHVVIVTNDTDLAPAVQMLKQKTAATVGVVIPTTDHARIPNAELVKPADWVRTHINLSELQKSQLPRVIADPRRPVSKPISWYARPDLLEQALTLGQAHLGQQSKVFQWLNRPNPHWNDANPLDLLESGDMRVLEFMQSWNADQTMP